MEIYIPQFIELALALFPVVVSFCSLMTRDVRSSTFDKFDYISKRFPGERI
jgi:hypothetical protein